jgi:lipopolysaccharide/colanic/teichoic acid biosynthesis glycosyltransferase
MPPSRIASAHRSSWNRIRVQLGGGLLIATLVPYVVRTYLDTGYGKESLDFALTGTVVALLAGYLSFRQTSRFPGVKVAYGILPTFGLSYGLVMAAFLLLRIDYSRLQFVSSFLLCVVWYHLVHWMMRRSRPLFAILPFGRVADLKDVPGPDWVEIDSHSDEVGPVDAIVADLHADIPSEWERFLADQALNGVLVFHVKQVRESLTGRVEIEHLSENTFGSLIPGIVYAKVKRAVDFLAALALALPVLIVLIPAGIAIRLNSPGPIFFRQRRVGYRGDTFTVLKLRTMRSGVESDGDPREAAITRDFDDRITRVGRFLRYYRLDELPQLINVLKGEMSWIGPRPEAVPLAEWYEAELPFYRYRHIVRPGVTGWAQVNQGHVAAVGDVLWKLHYDFFYIRNFSFWLDVLIVARTVRTLLTGYGSK